MPTCILKAPRYEAPASLLEAIEDNLRLVRAEPVPQHPTVQLHRASGTRHPVGKSAGLPVSMQLVGRFFDDPLLLRIAYAYEQSVDWNEVIAVSG